MTLCRPAHHSSGHWQPMQSSLAHIMSWHCSQRIIINGRKWSAQRTNFPNDYLLNALGNLYLQHYEPAEKSALRGLELDKQHRFPQLEYVLGILLAQRHDYAAAVQHLRNYLSLSHAATGSQSVQKQIHDLEQLSASASAQR